VHLRRALLLFAIVLGLAALAASVSQPERDDGPAPTERRSQSSPSATRRAGPSSPVRLRFVVAGKRERRRLEVGRAALVTVETPEAGQVELEGLGLSAAADTHTPARFDVLVGEPARVAVIFRAADGDEPVLVGTLALFRAG
jgi:hypothetical protein